MEELIATFFCIAAGLFAAMSGYKSKNKHYQKPTN